MVLTTIGGILLLTVLLVAILGTLGVFDDRE